MYYQTSISIFILFSYFYLSYHPKTKLLFFIASYGYKQLNYLYIKIHNLLTLCENGYVIKIIIHHTNIDNGSYIRRFFCFKIKKYLDIKLIKISSHLGFYLTMQHRIYIKHNIHEITKYDHIGYFENDMDFTLSNLKYYFYTWKLIEKFKMKYAIPGFKRYEISKCDNGDIWKSCPDHTTVIRLKIIKNYAFISTKFAYSGMWILPISKLMKYINEIDFVSYQRNKNVYTSWGSREYYSCLYWEMHYVPIIPLSRIDECFVHHMSNRYLYGKTSIQISDIYNQMNICKTAEGLLKYNGYLKNRNIIISYKNISKYICKPIKNC